MAVAGLVVPLLLLFNYAAADDGGSARLTARVLSMVQIGLVFIIMASALQRMLLYVEAYGLTELRLYATAVMGALALILIWFCLTVLRGSNRTFAAGAVAALIVRVNAVRTAAGESFDELYMASLSADAVPGLLAALPDLDGYDRCATAHVLLRYWGTDREEDWRTWNAARVRARRQVERQRSQLEATACPLQIEPLD